LIGRRLLAKSAAQVSDPGLDSKFRYAAVREAVNLNAAMRAFFASAAASAASPMRITRVIQGRAHSVHSAAAPQFWRGILPYRELCSGKSSREAAVSKIDLDAPATARWDKPNTTNIWNGGNKDFETLKEAVRYVMEDLPQSYRFAAFILADNDHLDVEPQQVVPG
jgi:hypothetical protein